MHTDILADFRRSLDCLGDVPAIDTAAICLNLQRLQRQRTNLIKTRIMLDNRLVSGVATVTGYASGLDEAGRRKHWDEARKIIQCVMSGKPYGGDDSGVIAELVLLTKSGIEGFQRREADIESTMVDLASQLSVSDWIGLPEQRGIGIISLAKIVGEAGDLGNYAKPAKLWARMGLHPYTSDGETRMAGGWKRNIRKLTSGEWESYGHSPRRRSVAYVVGEGIIKGNRDGPYRQRYEREKEAHGYFYEDREGRKVWTKKEGDWKHPDWSPIHVELHCKLVATKLFLRELWNEWHGTSHATDGWRKGE